MPTRDSAGKFVRGSSGNPGGRPKGLAALIRQKVGDSGEKLVTIAFKIANDNSALDKDRLTAIGWLADHGFGKPLQAIELDARLGGSVSLAQSVDSMTTAERQARVRDLLEASGLAASPMPTNGANGDGGGLPV